MIALITMSCRKCARVWQATKLAIVNHPQCPFCGSERVRRHG